MAAPRPQPLPPASGQRPGLRLAEHGQRPALRRRITQLEDEDEEDLAVARPERVFLLSRKLRLAPLRLYARVFFSSRKLRLAPQGCAPWTPLQYRLYDRSLPPAVATPEVLDLVAGCVCRGCGQATDSSAVRTRGPGRVA